RPARAALHRARARPAAGGARGVEARGDRWAKMQSHSASGKSPKFRSPWRDGRQQGIATRMTIRCGGMCKRKRNYSHAILGGSDNLPRLAFGCEPQHRAVGAADVQVFGVVRRARDLCKAIVSGLRHDRKAQPVTHEVIAAPDEAKLAQRL